MRFEDLRHIVRASTDLLSDRGLLDPDQRAFVIVGSAAILVLEDERALPPMATRSDEADVVPPNDPDGTKATIIDAVLGELSAFHDANGYYAQGVSEDTAWLPTGWRDRVIPFEAPSVLTSGRGLALERHDLAASKLAAGRIKDFEFVDALIAAGVVDVPSIRERLNDIPLGPGRPARIAAAQKWLAGR